MIIVTYSSVDGCKIRRRYSTLGGARAFAVEWIGADADIGSTYAMSSDGIGKIEVSGVTLAELFRGGEE